LRKAVAASPAIGELCFRYNEVLLAQARVTAACNAVHQIEARFCRWLLQTRDRAETDSIMLTQEFLSEMLGVRRTSVTEVASKLQAAGAISNSRGRHQAHRPQKAESNVLRMLRDASGAKCLIAARRAMPICATRRVSRRSLGLVRGNK
jgi:hypothetical protein